MKNIPAVWCLERHANTSRDAPIQTIAPGEYVVCLEGPGTVQVQSDNEEKTITLTETNPCCVFNLLQNARITVSLFSSPGLQWVQVYRRVK